jgi:hypothetical protein
VLSTRPCIGVIVASAPAASPRTTSVAAMGPTTR